MARRPRMLARRKLIQASFTMSRKLQRNSFLKRGVHVSPRSLLPLVSDVHRGILKPNSLKQTPYFRSYYSKSPRCFPFDHFRIVLNVTVKWKINQFKA